MDSASVIFVGQNEPIFIVAVYLIGNENKTAFKIGYTMGPVSSRLKQLQTGHHENLKIYAIAEVRNSTRVEKMMHGRYAHKKLNGEWFELNEKEIESFIKNCTDADEAVNFMRGMGNPWV